MPIGIMQISETHSDIHCGCDVNGDMAWLVGEGNLAPNSSFAPNPSRVLNKAT